MPRQCAAMQKHDLLTARQCRLPRISGLRKTNREHYIGPRAEPGIPEPGAEKCQDNPPHTPGQPTYPPPAPRRDEGFLTLIDTDLAAVRVGFRLAQRRANIAEQLHALRANGFRADAKFFRRYLARVFRAVR